MPASRAFGAAAEAPLQLGATRHRASSFLAAESHGAACSCSLCSGQGGNQAPPEPSRPPAVGASGQEVIQKCDHCGDSTCKKGEKCKKDSTMEGLFPTGSETWGTKYYNQKEGHGGKPMEWEHAVPGKAYRTAGMGVSYKSAPVLQIPKVMHRSGVSGGGGGISSTGSSHSASTWSSGMGGQLAGGDFGGALWNGVADGMHSAMATSQHLPTAANGYYRLINMHHERGDIDKGTRDNLHQRLMNLMLDMQQNPKRYGGK